jgi:hypothetical protein
VRTADAINMTTRTLLIEIDVDNPSGTLLTGSYAEVHLAVPAQASTYLLPVNTLIFRSEGLRVGIVKGGKALLSAVTPGHDFGNEIEIVAGLNADDQVIINPPDSIVSGSQSKSFRPHCWWRVESFKSAAEAGMLRQAREQQFQLSSAGDTHDRYWDGTTKAHKYFVCRVFNASIWSENIAGCPRWLRRKPRSLLTDIYERREEKLKVRGIKGNESSGVR